MKAVIQRVSSARVKIDGIIKGEIGIGLLVLIAFSEKDTEDTLKWMSNKIVNLRVFPDEEGKMNRSAIDCNGEILFVSNFTVYGNVKKGFRPSFTDSASPEIAAPIYNKMLNYLKDNNNIKIEAGSFGAMMDIELVNDGPVTVIIEK